MLRKLPRNWTVISGRSNTSISIPFLLFSWSPSECGWTITEQHWSWSWTGSWTWCLVLLFQEGTRMQRFPLPGGYSLCWNRWHSQLQCSHSLCVLQILSPLVREGMYRLQPVWYRWKCQGPERAVQRSWDTIRNNKKSTFWHRRHCISWEKKKPEVVRWNVWKILW